MLVLVDFEHPVSLSLDQGLDPTLTSGSSTLLLRVLALAHTPHLHYNCVALSSQKNSGWAASFSRGENKMGSVFKALEVSCLTTSLDASGSFSAEILATKNTGLSGSWNVVRLNCGTVFSSWLAPTERQAAPFEAPPK